MTFVHLDGLQGFNIALVTSWVYTEKPSHAKKQGQDASSMVVTFGPEQALTLEGRAADALHRYFCTHAQSLT